VWFAEVCPLALSICAARARKVAYTQVCHGVAFWRGVGLCLNAFTERWPNSTHRQVHAIFPTSRKSKLLARVGCVFVGSWCRGNFVSDGRGDLPLCSSDDPFVQTCRERILFDVCTTHRKISELQLRAKTVSLVASLLFLVRLS